jgi:hypothetical protein
MSDGLGADCEAAGTGGAVWAPQASSGMTRTTSPAAYDAIASTLPVDALPWPVHRPQDGPNLHPHRGGRP